MPSISSVTFEKEGYILCKFDQAFEIPSTAFEHDGGTEKVDSFYVKSPIAKDLEAINRINKAIIKAKKATFAFQAEMALKIQNDQSIREERSKKAVKEEKEPTREESMTAFLASVHGCSCEEYDEIISVTWELVKKKVYTYNGFFNSEKYDSVPIDILSNNDRHFEMINEMSVKLSREYLVFFMKYFSALLQMV